MHLLCRVDFRLLYNLNRMNSIKKMISGYKRCQQAPAAVKQHEEFIAIIMNAYYQHTRTSWIFFSIVFLFSFFFFLILWRREHGFCSLPPIYYVNFNWMIIYLNRGSTLPLCARKLLFEQSKIFQANCSGMQMCILKSVKIFIQIRSGM